MSENIVNSSGIIVVKRDGKKVDFNKAKIAVAIKKGFDSIKLENGENKYTEKDINIVLNKVLTKIEKENIILIFEWRAVWKFFPNLLNEV